MMRQIKENKNERQIQQKFLTKTISSNNQYKLWFWKT